jgi:transcriptional regulator with XRE-family HTH domain
MNRLNVMIEYLALKESAAVVLREYRGSRSYQSIADEFGTSKSYIWYLEHGRIEMPNQLLLKILEKLDRVR